MAVNAAGNPQRTPGGSTWEWLSLSATSHTHAAISSGIAMNTSTGIVLAGFAIGIGLVGAALIYRTAPQAPAVPETFATKTCKGMDLSDMADIVIKARNGGVSQEVIRGTLRMSILSGTDLPTFAKSAIDRILLNVVDVAYQNRDLTAREVGDKAFAACVRELNK